MNLGQRVEAGDDSESRPFILGYSLIFVVHCIYGDCLEITWYELSFCPIFINFVLCRISCQCLYQRSDTFFYCNSGYPKKVGSIFSVYFSLISLQKYIYTYICVCVCRPLYMYGSVACFEDFNTIISKATNFSQELWTSFIIQHAMLNNHQFLVYR